jgi:hypothetical protein
MKFSPPFHMFFRLGLRPCSRRQYVPSILPSSGGNNDMTPHATGFTPRTYAGLSNPSMAVFA